MTTNSPDVNNSIAQTNPTFSLSATSDSPTTGGMGIALTWIVTWIEGIQAAQGAFANWAASDAKKLAARSDAQFTDLSAITQTINAGPVDDVKNDSSKYTNWLDGLQDQYTQTQLKYNGWSSSAQSLMESKQNMDSDLGKISTGDFTNANSLAQFWADIASLMTR